MTMEILKVQDLCKTYGKGEAKVEALKKVSLSLDKGEFAAVVGESGSGKSTLLNCIGALDTPTSGHILVDGQDLFSMKEEQRTIFRRRNIGFIFQSFQLVSELNVEQNIIFPLLLDYRKPDPAEVLTEYRAGVAHKNLAVRRQHHSLCASVEYGNSETRFELFYRSAEVGLADIELLRSFVYRPGLSHFNCVFQMNKIHAVSSCGLRR